MSRMLPIIANRLRYYRTEQGLTQEALAEKAEMHTTYIGQVERGEKNITLGSLERILDALDISFEEFFQGMDVSVRPKDIPAQCYDLLRSKSKRDQKLYFQILQSIDALQNPVK